MQTLSFISPKSMLNRIADMFQKPQAYAAQPTQYREEAYQKTEAHNAQTRSESMTAPKSKLNVSVEDLKIISTALLHYKRNLAKIGEMEKAENVAGIDKKFYDLITQLSE